MKKKILLLLTFVAVITVLFAISASAAEPIETWDISATSSDSVTAYLYSKIEGYICISPRDANLEEKR